jgi:hypothetical protein
MHFKSMLDGGGWSDLRPVRFEDFTAVTMKNGFFWYVTPCCSCKNRHIGGIKQRASVASYS